MSLAIFDLDNTLLGGDSDYCWSQFLIERGIVDGLTHESENQRFYADYLAGMLDIYAFLKFQLRPLAEHDMAQLHAWRADFLCEKIQPILLPKARELVENHRARGDILLIITATNRFITAPIAVQFGIENLLATEPEIEHGRYTGGVIDTPCYQEGKVTRLRKWLVERNATLGESSFYSDSHNDLPLLSLVTHPVAVDPDETLRHHARAKSWPIISLR